MIEQTYLQNEIQIHKDILRRFYEETGETYQERRRARGRQRQWRAAVS